MYQLHAHTSTNLWAIKGHQQATIEPAFQVHNPVAEILHMHNRSKNATLEAAKLSQAMNNSECEGEIGNKSYYI